MNIGKKIIEIRKQKNMTQEDFAKIFHVTRQTVSNWENEKSYPDLQTLVQISDKFEISLDTMLKENTIMVKKIDHYKIYKKILICLITFLFIVAVVTSIYVGICKIQHANMYTKVENAGFKKELTETFIEKYQGNYALTEDSTDYLVTPKSIGKYELDIDNFLLTARKGDRDITIMIDENRKIFLSLYPGQVEIDENGNSNVCDQSGGFPSTSFSPLQREIPPLKTPLSNPETNCPDGKQPHCKNISCRFCLDQLLLLKHGKQCQISEPLCGSFHI